MTDVLRCHVDISEPPFIRTIMDFCRGNSGGGGNSYIRSNVSTSSGISSSNSSDGVIENVYRRVTFRRH